MFTVPATFCELVLSIVSGHRLGLFKTSSKLNIFILYLEFDSCCVGFFTFVKIKDVLPSVASGKHVAVL